MVEHFSELLRFGALGWGDELLWGLGVTLVLAVSTLPLGIFLGLFVAWGRYRGVWGVRFLANGYASFFRGVPEFLTLLMFYYGGQILLDRLLEGPFGFRITIGPFLAGVLALGAVFSAYASEVFLGAFRNIHREEWEAALALGFGRVQASVLVIFPHFLRLSLPGLSNLWLVLLKETSLVSVIALDDLLRKTTIAVGVTREPFFFYSVCCGIYLLLSACSILGISRLDRWARRGLEGGKP